MLSVDDFLKIRLAHRDGMSVREIARRFGWSRQSVRKALANAEPSRPRLGKPRASMLDAWKPVIDAILTDDRQQPVKQRHTAMRIFERLHYSTRLMTNSVKTRLSQIHMSLRRNNSLPSASQ